MNKTLFKQYIENSEFPQLFLEQGWDNFKFTRTVTAKDNSFTLTGIAEKRNFPVILCAVKSSKIPDANTRKQLYKSLSKSYYEHLLIFINKDKTEHFWQLPLYEDKKLKKLVTFSWHKGQDVEGVFQKLRNIVFELREEDYITLLDVIERVNTISSNNEQVTKKFYAEFVKEHGAFLAFIKGIDDALPDKENEKKQWYASLTLNRLMFCYFIQKKGFLDWNIHYLREKLAECKKLKGKNNFYGFYRSFLLRLFHDELGRPEEKRKKADTPVKFGKIPYLNGGLFDLHELETAYQKIAIEDKAFERIFAFFDEWNWHLDTRVTASGKDINPDVIGYIFEKYINQKEMGAYYTKEDITDYIGKNTIIPFLLDKVKSYYPAPFEPGYGFWQYLQDSGDEYIYDSVKKGAEGFASIDEVTIPENIRKGIDTVAPNLLERRKDWNTATPEETGLPTEIWRETISRLQRYFELREKIKKGQLQEINDLITYNLDICKLMQNYLEQTQDAKFIRSFYKALCEITILDPTCGSGAFLFAALKILEPLYEICIRRMEEFYNANPKGNTDFEQRLAPIHSEEHPNLSYYIYKTIILHNLYGVDLMKEAVEIAKLRLFLKLVAEVDPSKRKPNFGLEPLPDIDFNIRSGNTLVGFATEQQLEEVVRNTEGNLIYKEKLAELKSSCKTAALSYGHFQTAQVSFGINSDEYKEIKKNLTAKLKELSEKLNRYLADTYGLGSKTQWKSQKEKDKAYQEWKNTHQPFHWFAEFYEIISKGGFDVVIGNPPYVEYSKIKSVYTIKAYETESCGNLYAYVVERCLNIVKMYGKLGFIIPLSSVSTSRMTALTNLYRKLGLNIHLSFFAGDSNPSLLFNGVKCQLSIQLMANENKYNIYCTNYIRWFDKYRFSLFNNISYCHQSGIEKIIYKTGNKIELQIIDKVKMHKTSILELANSYSNEILYYRNASGSYYRLFLTNLPKLYINNKLEISTTLKELKMKEKKEIIHCLMSSTLFHWFWVAVSDNYHITNKELAIFNFDTNSITSFIDTSLTSLSKELAIDYDSNSKYREEKDNRRIVNRKVQIFFPRKSKPIIDEIDKILAKHYGFTEEELDFIINYDIKYRMGGELDNDE